MMADDGKPKARYVGPKIKRGASAVTAGETKVKRVGLETPHQKGMAKRQLMEEQRLLRLLKQTPAKDCKHTSRKWILKRRTA
tara:strand:+ start:46 stop:291 length:246 start_codon:yes stop_codon:yes gene_type:complete